MRTRFKKEIIAEFLPPVRPSKKVLILLGGMPGVPRHRELVDFFAKKGYWTFYPRYRGTWESGGRFLKKSPENDVIDILDELPRGFRDLWSGRKYRVRAKKIFLIGGSFGGPAAILASRDPRVTKAVALTPVVDWREEEKSPEEPMSRLGSYLRKAFGSAYRFSSKDWQRLSRGLFYNPINHLHEFDSKKLLIIYTADDKLVLPGPTKKFVKAVGCKSLFLSRGGHFGIGTSAEPRYHRLIAKFFSKK